jgi:hypothetical protein
MQYHYDHCIDIVELLFPPWTARLTAGVIIHGGFPSIWIPHQCEAYIRSSRTLLKGSLRFISSRRLDEHRTSARYIRRRSSGASEVKRGADVKLPANAKMSQRATE